MNQTYEAYCVDLSMYFRFSLLVFFFLFLLLLILLLTRPTRVRCLLTLLSTRLPPPLLLAPDLPPCSLPPQHKAYLCHVSGSASHYSESSSSFLSSSGSVQDFFFLLRSSLLNFPPPGYSTSWPHSLYIRPALCLLSPPSACLPPPPHPPSPLHLPFLHGASLSLHVMFSNLLLRFLSYPDSVSVCEELDMFAFILLCF